MVRFSRTGTGKYEPLAAAIGGMVDEAAPEDRLRIVVLFDRTPFELST